MLSANACWQLLNISIAVFSSKAQYFNPNSTNSFLLTHLLVPPKNRAGLSSFI